MLSVKVTIAFSGLISGFARKVDGSSVALNKMELDEFCKGAFGDPYLVILVHSNDVARELHAEKASMMKKGAIFDISPSGDDAISINVSGVFKVNAYTHVVEELKSGATMYVVGLQAWVWTGPKGYLGGYNKESNTSPVTAQII